MERSILLIPLFFFVNAVLIAQTHQLDTAFVSVAIQSTKNVYSQVMKDQIQLYNGGQYKEYRSEKDEHPYFISEEWITGSIRYNGEYYEKVDLLYNAFTDQVIVEQYPYSLMIQLVKDKVQSFEIMGHQFVLLRENMIPIGFYDQLCNGKVKVYAKRIKDYHETISSNELHHDYIEKSKYYINKDGSYYPVRSKKSVLNVLSDRKRELNQFIQQSHIRFSKNREDAIIKLTEFYNRN